jgi:hypothetical protein
MKDQCKVKKDASDSKDLVVEIAHILYYKIKLDYSDSKYRIDYV